MGSISGDASHAAAVARPTDAEIELAPLTDTNGEVHILTAELERKASADVDETAHSMPWSVIPVLILAVCSVSSAGVTFAMVADVPALRLGAWRLQITTTLCSPTCCWQFVRLPADLKRKTLQSCGRLAFSGICLAIHFSSWVWGIKHTSLVHAYLFVSVTPLAIAVGSLLLRKPISSGEVGGTLLGVAGAAVLTLGPKAGHREATLLGDMVTLIGAISIIGYLEVGQKLRSFMPLMVYAVPVTGVAALTMTLGSLALERSDFAPLGTQSVVGYLNGTHILPVLWLAVVPGILGHQGLNLSLKYISPLALSLSTASEPIIGSVLGFFLGLTAAPTVWMYIGGAMIISATVVVTVASHRRKSNKLNSVKRRLSFANVPTTDQDESVSTNGTLGLAHERSHLQNADV